MNADKENTFRALRDEELLVTSKWCRFGIHRWTKWRPRTTETNLTWKIGGYGRRYVFNRRCIHCDYIDQRRRWMYEEMRDCGKNNG